MIETIHLDLSDKEQEQVQKYMDEHFCEEFKNGSGGFGSTSKLQFLVGWTTIGPTLSIVCPYCGYTEDITDIDTW